MTLSTVTVTWNVEDLGLQPLGGTVSFQLSAVLTDGSSVIVADTAPLTYNFAGGTGTSEPLVANDNVTLSPAGTYYAVTLAVPGSRPLAFSAQVNHANGATQSLALLYASQAQPVAQYAQFMPLPSGTPASGQVPVATGTGEASAWSSVSGTGTVTAVSVATANGFAGTVANPATTPAVTVKTTVTGLLKGNGTAVSAAAAGTDYVAPAGNAATATNLAGDTTFPKRVAPAVVALTDGSSVAIDASAGNVFDWPLGGGSHTLAAPGNAVDGDLIVLRIGYSGSFTPLFNAIFDFNGSPPAWTATSGKEDEAAFRYRAASTKWRYQGSMLGFTS